MTRLRRPSPATRLNHRHAIDFDVEGAGERGHVQEDARWRLVREIARVNVVEDGEVRWLWRAIDVAFEHLRQRRARSLETFLHLRKNDLGLALERQAFDLAGAGLEWRQTGQEYKTAGEGNWIDRPF